MEEKNSNEQSGTPPTEEAILEQESPESFTSETQPVATTDAEPTAAPATSEVGQASSATPWAFIGAVVVVIALLAGGVWWLSQSDGAADLGVPTAGTQTPTFSAGDYPEVIAVVNGVEVSSERFVQGLEQAAQQVAQQGADPTDEATLAQMEAQTATALVNTELLVQAAAAAGVSADSAAVDAELEAIAAQFGSEEVFQEELSAAGLTLEELRADFAEQLTIDAFIRQTPEWSELTVGEGEAQAFYDDIAAQNAGQELPPFADVEAAIEEQLLGTKQQEVTQALIDRLRADAEIEVLI